MTHDELKDVVIRYMEAAEVLGIEDVVLSPEIYDGLYEMSVNKQHVRWRDTAWRECRGFTRMVRILNTPEYLVTQGAGVPPVKFTRGCHEG